VCVCVCVCVCLSVIVQPRQRGGPHQLGAVVPPKKKVLK